MKIKVESGILSDYLDMKYYIDRHTNLAINRIAKRGLFTERFAEAAKVIENIQRDLNIALMNELAIIFHKMHLDIK